MPSARELLEQADALMRRNRTRAVDTEIPELTEVIPAIVPPIASSRPVTLDDVPELTDAVEEIEIQSIAEMPEETGEPSAWLLFDRADPHPVDGVAGSAAHSASVHPLPLPGGERVQSPRGDAALSGTAAAAIPLIGSAPPTAPDDDWARWQALADEVRMEVLQRIDIFADAGLHEQLGAHLQPIVERAGAELVATINEQIGSLLRAHIARLIEREIESRRNPGS